ncbi:hypothetical protein [Rossellomorea aquimaris]|uniref:hypothetical protein n=1 Tax=Rossellomorea aquimaris TaxID=189382 RepID=UPI0007D07BC6|nr:hypothetical protein [Rossellomorea aquimaris]
MIQELKNNFYLLNVPTNSPEIYEKIQNSIELVHTKQGLGTLSKVNTLDIWANNVFVSTSRDITNSIPEYEGTFDSVVIAITLDSNITILMAIPHQEEKYNSVRKINHFLDTFFTEGCFARRLLEILEIKNKKFTEESLYSGKSIHRVCIGENQVSFHYVNGELKLI